MNACFFEMGCPCFINHEQLFQQQGKFYDCLEVFNLRRRAEGFVRRTDGLNEKEKRRKHDRFFSIEQDKLLMQINEEVFYKENPYCFYVENRRVPLNNAMALQLYRKHVKQKTAQKRWKDEYNLYS